MVSQWFWDGFNIMPKRIWNDSKMISEGFQHDSHLISERFQAECKMIAEWFLTASRFMLPTQKIIQNDSKLYRADFRMGLNWIQNYFKLLLFSRLRPCCLKIISKGIHKYLNMIPKWFQNDSIQFPKWFWTVLTRCKNESQLIPSDVEMIPLWFHNCFRMIA